MTAGSANRVRTLLLTLVAAGTPAAFGQQAPAPGLTVEPERGIYGHLFEGPFLQPSGVYYDPSANELFICDAGGHRIAIANSAGVPKYSFGSEETLIAPNDVAVDPDGRIYVADTGHGAIRVFDYDGTPLPDFELRGLTEAERPFRPDALENWGDGFLVLDRSNRRVIVADAAGRVTLELSRPAGRSDLLASPTDLAVTGDGEFVVLDRRGLAVQIYDRTGAFLRGWGDHDAGPDSFSLPSGVAVDAEGRIFVADELRHDVKVFDSTGGFLLRFGGFGSAPGAVRHPVAITTDGQGRIFVSERTGGRVQVFRIRTPE